MKNNELVILDPKKTIEITDMISSENLVIRKQTEPKDDFDMYYKYNYMYYKMFADRIRKEYSAVMEQQVENTVHSHAWHWGKRTTSMYIIRGGLMGFIYLAIIIVVMIIKASH
jgi:hypothetical protein